ncbi:MAG: rRNA maturation RNase YbeY [Candidatus Staskawiczbacteria bacterium]|nr:rRNA maturation RNase YbeY [Candidatus Staskawiczbacteria bacterium]
MIEINNLTKFAVDKKSFAQVAKKVLSGENRETETLSLAFVSKEEIAKLNKKFRKKNKATDVLAFGENPKIQSPNPKSNYLGEIVICPDVVKENVPPQRDPAKGGTKKFKADFDREMMKVFVHGILHLCGYDHEKTKRMAEVMEEKQNLYLPR